MVQLFSSSSIVLVLALGWLNTAQSLNVKVKVELDPSPNTNLAQCTTSLLDGLLADLTPKVGDVLNGIVPGCTLNGLLTQVFHDGNGYRHLRGERQSSNEAEPEADQREQGDLSMSLSLSTEGHRELGIKKAPANAYTTCDVGGCSILCVDGVYGAVGGLLGSVMSLVDWTLVGTLASLKVQAWVQVYLATHLDEAGGCLGDPLLLKASVKVYSA